MAEGAAPLPREPGVALLGGLDVPRDTTPTFELEMLVSGAVLFGLFQIPPVLLALKERWLPHVEVLGLFAVTSLAMLGGAAVYALISCFLIHLVLRGYWVALVGVNSVFPGGVRWDKQREYGPIQSELLRARLRPLGESIARVDNAASLVFATGFVLAATTVTSVTIMAVLGGAAALAVQLLGAKAGLMVLAAVTTLLLGTFFAAITLDYKRGATLAPEGRAARFIRRTIRIGTATTPPAIYALSSTLASNVDKRVAMAATAVGLATTLGLSVYNLDGGAGIPRAGNYRYFTGDDAATAVNGARYGTLRGDRSIEEAGPWLDADVVAGPYLRLYVPYRPMRANPAFAKACGGLTPLDAEETDTPAARAAAGRVLACAGRLYGVTVDGATVPVSFRFFSDPRVNRRGFVAYLPTARLAEGEHVLRVRSLPSVWGATSGPPPAWTLPFWK